MKAVEIISLGVGLILGVLCLLLEESLPAAILITATTFILLFEDRRHSHIRLRPWVKRLLGIKTQQERYTEQDGIVFHISREGKAAVHSYNGNASELSIPKSLEGCPVTAIEDGAFMDCHELFRLHIPESVGFIGDNAFSNCGRVETKDEDLARAYTARSRRDLEFMFGYNYEYYESLVISGQSPIKTSYEFTAIVPSASYAEGYCEENNINYSLAQ